MWAFRAILLSFVLILILVLIPGDERVARGRRVCSCTSIFICISPTVDVATIRMLHGCLLESSKLKINDDARNVLVDVLRGKMAKSPGGAQTYVSAEKCRQI